MYSNFEKKSKNKEVSTIYNVIKAWELKYRGNICTIAFPEFLFLIFLAVRKNVSFFKRLLRLIIL